jgi:Lrp/AsnC family transcriptional regulator
MDVKIDEMDRKILGALQQDATLAMDALAERVNLSRNACWRRVKQLESAGVIQGRVALLDPQALGCGLSVVVLIRTNEHDPSWRSKFDAAVREMPQIIGAHRMSGDLDYVLRVRVADVAAYDRFYKKLTDRVAVSDISASFVMEDIKDTTALPMGNEL